VANYTNEYRDKLRKQTEKHLADTQAKALQQNTVSSLNTQIKLLVDEEKQLMLKRGEYVIIRQEARRKVMELNSYMKNQCDPLKRHPFDLKQELKAARKLAKFASQDSNVILERINTIRRKLPFLFQELAQLRRSGILKSKGDSVL
jgi:mRNA-degrading endonuclease RelE of RelBE toxin-antitoxin system